jgi:hypothetical protein
MPILLPLLAAALVPIPPGGGDTGRIPAWFKDVFLVVGLGLALLLGLVFWAVYIRKRSHRHLDPRVSYRVIDDEGEGQEGHGQRRRRHRHRRRRRDHRSRNPSLAETGGLPPPRPEDQMPPAA